MRRTLATVLASLTLAAPGAAAGLPEIKYEKFTLSNGLEVILHEDHSTPIAAVDIWYHVGSKNERPGRTGFAHLFEHMMFQGSKHYNDDYFKPLQDVGATLNGSTNTDRTNYWEIVPANFLELALAMESDRMGFLPDAMDQKKLDNQRDVVKNEKRQNYDNQPYGLSRELLARGLYPAGHPYSWLTIGSMEDLSAASLDDVKEFFRSYYTPSNATLVVAGDFNPVKAKEMITRYFAGLPPGPPVKRVARWVPRLDGVKQFVAQDRVQLPRLYLVWPSAPGFAPGDAELDVLASVLSRGKSSRLYKSLVYDKQIAQDVSVYQTSGELASSFVITVTARPGHDLGEITQAVDAELARIQAEGPSVAELDRVKNTFESDFITRLQNVGGSNSVSDLLNYYNHYLGDPGGFNKDFDRYMKIDGADVKRVANATLVPERLELRVLPMPEVKADASPLAQNVDRDTRPEAGPNPSLTLPSPRRKTLANGLQLMVVEQHELPVVALNLVVKSGAATDPVDKPGIASLTALMLNEGTAKRSSIQISDDLAALGASLQTSADFDATSVEMTTITKHLSEALEIFGDVVAHPTFPADELERQRKSRLTRILQEQDQPNAIATKTLNSVVYGKTSPYGHPDVGTEASVKAVTRADIEAHYRESFTPANATLIVVGDTTLEAAATLLEKALADWKKAPAPAPADAEAKGGFAPGVYFVDKPGAAQSVVMLGQLGVPRNSPDFFPLTVMNTMLGGAFASRLNLNLREDKGYTYGARSQFDFRRASGPFIASAGVKTDVTSESLVEFMKELRGIRGDIPITDKELRGAKDYLIRRFPQRFETPADIATGLRQIVLYGLPDDTFSTYVAKLEAVALKDVARVAGKYIAPDRLAVVVVGDAATVRGKVAALNLGKLTDLDRQGGVVSPPAAK